MARKRNAVPLTGVVLLSGCMVNPAYLPDQYSTARLADGRLRIAISPEKHSQLVASGGKELDAFVATVVSKEKMCPNGFTTTEGTARGYVSIVVTCKHS